MLNIALPNKGALSEKSINIIKEAGYRCKRYGKELVVYDNVNDIEFYFLRPRDIATYVSNGHIDLGITGRDLALDSEAEYTELMPLNFGNSRFCYAVPQDSDLTPDKLENKRIVTSYPNIVKQDLEKRGVKPAKIIKVDGAVEISVKLGVADAVADVVESGRTLKEANLKIVGEPILHSEAIVIAKNNNIVENKDVKIFLQRLKGIVIARQYVMVEYDIPADLLEKACEITPGIESPTISSLKEKGWYSVKAMTKNNNINNILDDLNALGAKGVIVSNIISCRI